MADIDGIVIWYSGDYRLYGEDADYTLYSVAESPMDFESIEEVIEFLVNDGVSAEGLELL